MESQTKHEQCFLLSSSSCCLFICPTLWSCAEHLCNCWPDFQHDIGDLWPFLQHHQNKLSDFLSLVLKLSQGFHEIRNNSMKFAYKDDRCLLVICVFFFNHEIILGSWCRIDESTRWHFVKKQWLSDFNFSVTEWACSLNLWHHPHSLESSLLKSEIKLLLWSCKCVKRQNNCVGPVLYLWGDVSVFVPWHTSVFQTVKELKPVKCLFSWFIPVRIGSSI